MRPRLTSCALLLKLLERFGKRQCGSQIGLEIAERFHVMVNCDGQSDWSKNTQGRNGVQLGTYLSGFFFSTKIN